MQKKYVYKSIALHIAIVLLCIIDIPYFSSIHDFEETPPILVDLNDVTISDMTNLPELAVRGEERKVATRKEKPQEEVSASKQPKPQPEAEQAPKEEPVIEATEIKSPSLIEDAPKMEESKEDPAKDKKEPIKEKKKPAPVPQKKPQVKPDKKEGPKKKPENTKQNTNTGNTKKTNVKSANPLESLMNSVDDLQKQIGEEDAPAQIPYNEQVNNMGIEGGNSKGSYFSEITVSGIDFVKSKIQESWKTIAGGKDDRNIAVVINVKLTRRSIELIEIEDMKRYRSDNYFQALADSAERAIHIAQDVHGVFKVLANQSASRYNEWKQIRFTFTPLGLAR